MEMSFTDSLVKLSSFVPREVHSHGAGWEKITTPLHGDVWERELAGHPDRVLADYVCEGIRRGFRIGFDYGLCQCTRALRNMKSVSEHREVVEEYIRGEVEAGRVMGPFSREVFPGVQVSPFGVIPKSEPGKWRLIIDLSAPKGSSVNDGIDPALCSLAYLSVDSVMRRVREAGQGALLAKFDLKSAYRNVPVHPDDRWLLGMLWDDQLFVDSVLPFGLRSAPKIFTAVASMLAYVIRKRDVCWLDHYLDDYVLVGPPRSPVCQRSLGTALEVCRDVGFPVVERKTVGPVTTLELLGIEFDTEELILRLPQRKLVKLRELVRLWRKKKFCTKRELQSLAGHLSHACKVVRPGRRFLRGVFGLLSLFQKKTHLIRLNSAFRADMEWWFIFVGSWNGVSMMLDLDLKSPAVHFWSDASGSWGCGAWWGSKWFQVPWSDWPDFLVASIAAKELLPVIVAAAIWGESWQGSVVLCHCDNMSVVAAVKGGYCKDPAMGHMLRCLFYLEARFSFTLTAEHVAGVENGVADAISRNKLATMFCLSPQMSRVPSTVPHALVGGLIVSRNWTSEDWTGWLGSLSATQ